MYGNKHASIVILLFSESLVLYDNVVNNVTGVSKATFSFILHIKMDQRQYSCRDHVQCDLP